ncbi:MAG: hypothetical protein ACYCS3_08300 [Acidithiobacillus sp.]
MSRIYESMKVGIGERCGMAAQSLIGIGKESLKIGYGPGTLLPRC